MVLRFVNVVQHPFGAAEAAGFARLWRGLGKAVQGEAGRR